MNTPTQTPNQGLKPQPEYIKGLFSSISSTYDRANDAMTFGLARAWRKKVVTLSEAQPGQAVLDCATGTGDLAIAFKKAVGDGRVVGTDFCEEMLIPAPAKAKKEGLDVEFSVADAMSLPFEDNEFDICSISYGIRNVADPATALTDMARVTKPGGRVMILETGENKVPVIGSAMGWYFKTIVPVVGGLVSGNRQAYEYLNNSTSHFPSGSEFIELLESTGSFSECSFVSLMGGASYIYTAVVKENQ